MNSQADAQPSFRTHSPLSKAALRLLRALQEPGTCAVPDPTRDGSLIVRGGGPGVSLGRGSHAEAAGRELLGRDLVEPAPPGPGRTRLMISAAGAAHLRRASSGGGEGSFQAQHLEIVEDAIEEDGRTVAVSRNASESPLAWLRRRKDRDGEPLIDAASYEAGERLRRDLTIGGVLPSVTARWDAGGGGKTGFRDPAAAADAVIAARQRVRRALEVVGGDMANLLVDLCGFLKGLELIEREHRWPPRSAKVVLRLALRRLAQHYGLEVEATGPGRSAGIRSWAAELAPEPAST